MLYPHHDFFQAMLDVVGELRHLCGLDGTVVKSPPTSRKANRGGYVARSVSPKGMHTAVALCSFASHGCVKVESLVLVGLRANASG